MTSGLPFDAVRALIATMPGPDRAAVDAVRLRDAQLTKPPGALGRLEDLAQWLAAWQQRKSPRVNSALVAIFAGNHGVTAQGVSPFSAEVTAQMVGNFRNGGAAINQICKTFGFDIKVFELALEVPTEDISVGAALSEADCAATMAYGMEAVAGELDLLCIGEMGIGNTTIAAAICAALYGGAARDWVGPGTGLDSAGMAHKAAVIERALALHRAHLDDPLEVLRRVGGRELAAMAGAILGARFTKLPVVIDGYVASAAAAILHAMDPSALDHCQIGHCSAEPAHRRLVEKLGKVPLLDLGMRLGEGSGAAMAAGLIKAAANLHTGMATFAEAQVSNRDA